MPPYGVSFLEGMEPTDQQQRPGQTPASRAQEAIRVLQLRLPRGPNFGGVAPAPLLQGPGAMGAPVAGQQLSFQPPGEGGMNPLLQAIMGLARMPGGGIGSGGGPIPLPRVNPIEAPGGSPAPTPGPAGPPLPPPIQTRDRVVRPAPNPGGGTITQRPLPPPDFPVPDYFSGTSLPRGWGGMY